MRPLPSLPSLPSLSLRSLSLALPLVATLAGCGFTSGNDGRADFSYDSGSNCLLGCDTSKPLMVGTTETLSVGNLPANAGTLVSSAPGVVAVGSQTAMYQCNSHTATSATSSTVAAGDACPSGATKNASISASISALQAGRTTLAVYNADGSLFDSIDVSVSAPGKLQVIDQQSKVVNAITIVHGTETDYSVVALDGSGNPLQASAGFTFQVVNPSVADLQEHDFTLMSPVLPVHGDAAGTTSITVTAGSTTTSVGVTVE